MKADSAATEAPFRHSVYGITLHSELPLALPVSVDAGLATIVLRTAPASHFAERLRGVAFHPESDDWYRYAFLPDDSTYVCWGDVGEFLVSPGGDQIVCRRMPDASEESFQVYVLGQALSFALVQAGFEPLHSTAVVVDGRAVAFLGDSGYGKSSLAAAFVAAGHRVLTDDLLLVRLDGGVATAYPGPPRLKLFPAMASRLLGLAGAGVPLNTGADKLILPVERDRWHPKPVRLAAILALDEPWYEPRPTAVTLGAMSPRDALLALVANTFNSRLQGPARLRRQLQAMTALVHVVPVQALAYPRELAQLPAVVKAIETELAAVAAG